jgi:two-component system CheB/CheR fusion protein
MARTHEVLSSHNWGDADLEQLLRATFSPYNSTQRQNLILHGPPFHLDAATAAALGMVFFELASNAAKYGALSADTGHVEISWAVVKPGRLSIRWKEVGGPPVREPSRRNFGTTFIQQSLEYELGGSISLDFRPAGLECLLEIPLSRT